MQREIAGYVFKYIDVILAEIDARGVVRTFKPESGHHIARGLALINHGAGPFCRFTIARGIHKSGVYVITAGGEPVYVGKCRDLAQRFGPRGYGAIQPRNCFDHGQPTNCRINNLILKSLRRHQPLTLWFYARREPSSIERDIINKKRPPWNMQVPRQKNQRRKGGRSGF